MQDEVEKFVGSRLEGANVAAMYLSQYGSDDDVQTAIEALRHDYARHAGAARSLAEDIFAADRVLSSLLHALEVA